MKYIVEFFDEDHSRVDYRDEEVEAGCPCSAVEAYIAAYWEPDAKYAKVTTEVGVTFTFDVG